MKAERIQGGMGRIPGWALSEDGHSISRCYRFPSFRAAIAFVAFVAEVAEALQHHPDVDIRYDRVLLRSTTHDAGGLTDKDFELAARIDQRG